MKPETRKGLMYNDYRQEPIVSEQELAGYKEGLKKLEAAVKILEDDVMSLRSANDLNRLQHARSSLLHLLLKWQGIVDAIYTYEHSKKRHEKTLIDSDRALALDPNNASAWMNKGIALLHLNQPEEALIASDHALALEPNNAHAWDLKAFVLRSLERIEEAQIAESKAKSLR